MPQSFFLTRLALCITVVFALSSPSAAIVIKARQAGLSVMVVGDSISQGLEGDWTWRYRLWEWFQDQGVGVDFVGPYTGTVPPTPPAAPSPPPLLGSTAVATDPGTTGGYAIGVTSGWPSNHYALWGHQCAEDIGTINAQVATYMPDYLLVELGFNDLAWFINEPAGIIVCMETLITNARAANPNLNFAIANLPQRTYLGSVNPDLPEKTTEYNELLAAAISQWSTDTSQVELVELQENYDCAPASCPAGHDGLHPNALGEYQIAQAFSITLYNDFHLGNGELSIPTDVPERTCTVPTNVQAVASPDGITVTWDAIYGVYGYEVISQLVGETTTWADALLSANRYDTVWTQDGWNWQYQVRTNNGDVCVSAWSGIVTAVSYPETPGVPLDIAVVSTPTGIDFAWSPPTGAYSDTVTLYEIMLWEDEVEGSYVDGWGVDGLSAHVDGLVPGTNYLCVVEAWNANGQGYPQLARQVVIGYGTPPAPTNLQITSIDATTVQIEFCGSPYAGGYRVWTRNINNASSVLTPGGQYGSSIYTSFDMAWLFPGVWNYEFCVSAYNGNAESGLSNCEVAPQTGVVGGPVGGSGCYAYTAPTAASTTTNPGGYSSTAATSTSAPTSTTTLTGKAPAYPLDEQSACVDIALNASGHGITSAMWDEVEATTGLQDWMNTYLGDDAVMDLARLIGVDQQMKSCAKLDLSCVTPNCVDLSNPGGNGTAWEYLVMVAVSNLAQVVDSIYQAVGTAPSNITHYESDLQQAFLPTVADSMLLPDILTGISTGISIISTLTGDVEAGAAGAFFSGVISEAISSLSSSDDAGDLVSLLDMEAVGWASALQSSIAFQWENAMDLPSAALPEIFMHGSWVDYRNIPILSTTSSTDQATVNEYYLNALVSSLVNSAWTAENVYISCYPMDVDTFNTTKVNAGNNNADLKFYTSDGKGCYLQAINPDSDTFAETVNPPGYADLTSSAEPGQWYFSAQDIIQSSYATFGLGGFNHTLTPTDLADNIFNLNPSDILSGAAWGVAGTFNLPICQPTGWTLSEFFDNLNAPGDVGSSFTSSWCGCQDVKDQNNNTIVDVISILKELPCSCNPAICCVETGSIVTCG